MNSTKSLTVNQVLKILHEEKGENFMADFNQVTLVGRLTKDPEIRTTKSGKKLANMSIAVNKYSKDEPANFFNVQCWEKTADFVDNYLSKGSQILISGSLEQQVWEDNGQKHQRVIVVARTVQGLSPLKKKTAEQEDLTEPISFDDIPF